MNNKQSLTNEITEVNLSYLILAQQMIRADKASALYRLGISEHVSEVIQSLKPSQLLKIAQSNTLICQIRGADDLVWNLLADHAKDNDVTNTKTAAQMHAQVLLAGKHSEVI
jgi:flagellar transcriptional activator FlhD